MTEPTGSFPFSTVGLDVDRYERVWAAGAAAGTGRVYDGFTGDLLATYEFTAPLDSLINDVIVAEHAHEAEWRFAVTDDEGRPVHTGTTRRRPTTQQRRDVEARHPRCVFPGCRMPAGQCDLDHTTPWAGGGQTTITNLSPLCRHDHRLRHEAGWGYRRTENGDLEWISPLGQRYVTSGRPP